jgi:hypothetical protein
MAVRYDLQDSLHGNTVPVDSTDRAVPPMSWLLLALLAGAAPPVVLPRPASLEKRA